MGAQPGAGSSTHRVPSLPRALAHPTVVTLLQVYDRSHHTYLCMPVYVRQQPVLRFMRCGPSTAKTTARKALKCGVLWGSRQKAVSLKISTQNGCLQVYLDSLSAKKTARGIFGERSFGCTRPTHHEIKNGLLPDIDSHVQIDRCGVTYHRPVTTVG